MKHTFSKARIGQWLAPTLLFALLTMIASAYWLALPGFFLFDEPPNLDGLIAAAEDWRQSLLFVSSGEAGRLGRPFSLFTFALQADAWPDNPELFLRVNIAIHVLATLFAFLLATGLATLRPTKRMHTPVWIGLSVAVLWGLSPFLATTHLMIVQRMASLAGLLSLIALSAFVWAHHIKDDRAWSRRALLAIGLGAGTALATLSKENGALVPLLALIISWLWIPPNLRLRGQAEKVLIALLVIIPSAALFVYLGTQLSVVMEHGYGPHRYFTPGERFMSQPAILLDYVRNLFLPRAASVSPFMDHLPAPRSWLDPPLTLISILAWVAALGFALAVRRSVPVLLFGLIFFLSGHLLESTFIGLELYFAHRNYLPSFGLYFAFVFAAFSLSGAQRKYALVGLTAYAGMFAAVLLQVTAGWMNTDVNAELWFDNNPNSQRAAQFLSNEYVKNGDILGARNVLDIGGRNNPHSALIHIQRTGNCINKEEHFPELVAEVTGILRTALYQPQAAGELVKMAGKDPPSLCPLRDHTTIASMADALLDNPLFLGQEHTRSLLLLAKAFAHSEGGRILEAMDLFEESFWLAPNLDVLFYGASLMANAGEYPRAYDFIAEGRERAPKKWLERNAWRDGLDGFYEIIRESERLDAGEPHG